MIKYSRLRDAEWSKKIALTAMPLGPTELASINQISWAKNPKLSALTVGSRAWGPGPAQVTTASAIWSRSDPDLILRLLGQKPKVHPKITSVSAIWSGSDLKLVPWLLGPRPKVHPKVKSVNAIWSGATLNSSLTAGPTAPGRP